MTIRCNLLPLAVRRRQLIRRRLRYWCAFEAAVALGLGVWLYVLWSGRVAEERRNQQLASQAMPVVRLQQQLQDLRRQIRGLEERENLFLELEGNAQPLSLIGLVSRGARSCRGTIGVDHVDVKTETNTKAAQSAAKPPQTRHIVTLKGQGANKLAIAQFVLALRDSKAFDVVELKSTKDENNSPDGLSTYSIECVY